MVMMPSLRTTRVTGLAFSVLFTLALTVGLGDLFGAFADPAETFPAYFDSGAERVRHAAGAYLLAASGLAFVLFGTSFPRRDRAGESGTRALPAPHISAVFASLVGLAAAALATVSMSIGFGAIVGDPGIREAEHLLPQLGYVILTVPGALAGGLAVWLLAGTAEQEGTLPRWIVGFGRLAAVGQLLAFYTLPLVLLPVWTLIASFGVRASSGGAGAEGRDGLGGLSRRAPGAR